MKEAARLIKQLVGNEVPVFVEPSIHVFGDPSTQKYVGLLKRPAKDRGYDDQVLNKYHEFKDRLHREGYHVEEADASETDGFKGKQVGNRLVVYKGLDALDRLHVLVHEYIENRLMRTSGRPDYELHPEVQRLEEELFGPGGDLEFWPAYAHTVEAGNRTGMRKPQGSTKTGVVFG